MKYRVIWHSLLADGPLQYCECRLLFFAHIRCFLLNCMCSRDAGYHGERIRWYAVERI